MSNEDDNKSFKKQSRSIFTSRLCQKDPEDDKMLICKVHERRIENGNLVNEEREERVQIMG